MTFRIINATKGLASFRGACIRSSTCPVLRQPFDRTWLSIRLNSSSAPPPDSLNGAAQEVAGETLPSRGGDTQEPTTKEGVPEDTPVEGPHPIISLIKQATLPVSPLEDKKDVQETSGKSQVSLSNEGVVKEPGFTGEKPKEDIAIQALREVLGGEYGTNIASDIWGKDLPTLPLATGYPAPWFTAEDFETYIEPLYSRGWGLKLHKEENTHGGKVFSSALVAIFILKGWNDLTTFYTKIVTLANRMKHHPHSIHIKTAEHNTVRIRMELETHSARRNDWTPGIPKMINKSRHSATIPGVTKRDIRLALTIERLFTILYKSEKGSKIPCTIYEQPNAQTIREHFKKPILNPSPSTCHECGIEHSVAQCPKFRNHRSILTIKECPKCGKMHGPMRQCPSSKKSTPAPVAPCPNCGGNHWLVDCRKPQLPPGEAESYMIPLPLSATKPTEST